MFASISHTHYWYEVGMLKVPAEGSKSRVTTRCTGRGEVGKMTHQPTLTQTNKNTQSKFDPCLGTCDVSVPPRSGRLSSSSGTQLLLL